MNKAIEFKTVKMIDSRSADSYNYEELIGMVQNTKAAIKSLTEANEGVESKTIEALIKKQEKALSSLISELDSRKID